MTQSSPRPSGALDFCSALYLGFRHPSWTLPTWESLTTGFPAAYQSAKGARTLAGAVSALQGLRGGLLAASTLHLYIDLVRWLSRQRVCLFVDQVSYPVARWAAALAPRQTPVVPFSHLDLAALPSRVLGQSRRPVVLVDDYCITCGRLLPLPDLVKLVRARQGLLVVDATQGLGVLGANPTTVQPLGFGGGGALRYHQISGDDVVTIASGAKAFGAPIGALCGSEQLVADLREFGTRLHCSAPATPSLRALERALQENAASGDGRRSKLLALTGALQSGLEERCYRAVGGPFPVQVIVHLSPREAIYLMSRLGKSNIRALPLRTHRRGDAGVAFALRSEHTERDIRRLLNHLPALDSPTNLLDQAPLRAKRSVWRRDGRQGKQRAFT